MEEDSEPGVERVPTSMWPSSSSFWWHHRQQLLLQQLTAAAATAWDRLSAPFAADGIRRPLSANVETNQKSSERFREGLEEDLGQRAGCVSPGGHRHHSQQLPAQSFLINCGDLGNILLLFSTLKWRRTLVQLVPLSLFCFQSQITNRNSAPSWPLNRCTDILRTETHNQLILLWFFILLQMIHTREKRQNCPHSRAPVVWIS